jgi:Uma2 family endonuclease
MAHFPAAIAEQAANAQVPPLENGDRLDQKTFHQRYEAMAEHVRAELIGGIVYMASPQKMPHGKSTVLIGRWLDEYAENTPGTEVLADATDIMGPESQPEPDNCLIILPEYGGQTHVTDDGYLGGAPELIVETASSTESRDLHQKKTDYERAGVREYVVVALRSQRVFWFALRGRRYSELSPGPDGILRSRIFPGLWLDPDALLRRDRKQLLAVVEQGLAGVLHQAFVAKLAARHRRRMGRE